MEVSSEMAERYDGRDRRRSRSRSYERRRRRSRSRNRSRSPRATRRASPERSAPLNKRQCWYAVKYDPIQIGSIDGTDTTPHDKALVRAMEARYDAFKDPKIQGDPYATLFVGRLAYTTSEATLERFFSSYGHIKHLRLVRDVVTQQSKGYAFVEFKSERSCLRAYQDAHRQELDGRVLLVDYERSRVMAGWKPRRLGGGLGGKKESGQLRFGGREHPFKPPR